MSRWTCPACSREFGRTNQSHVCLPGNSIAKSFAAHPEQRPIYDAIITHLKSLGPVHEDAVSVGVFLLHKRKLAEVRPKSRWLDLSLYLERTIDDPRIARAKAWTSVRTVNHVRLTRAEDVDDQLCEWLTEAYDLNG